MASRLSRSSPRDAVLWGVTLAVLAVWALHRVPSLGTVYEDLAWQSGAESGPIWAHGRPLSVAVWVALAHEPWSVQHLTAIAFHLVNAVLVWACVSRLGVSPAGAWVAAAVFLLHPFASEGISYLAARADVMATTGILLAVWCAQRAWWSVAGFALLGAMLCKETAIVGLVLLPLIARRPWLTIAALVGVMAFAAWHTVMAWQLPIARSWVVWELIAAGHQLSLLAWPWPSRLAVDYDYRALAPLVTLGYVALAVTVLVLPIVTWWRWPMVAMGTGWLAAIIAVRLVIVTPGSLLNAHQLYLGLVGVALLAGAGSDRLEVACRR